MYLIISIHIYIEEKGKIIEIDKFIVERAVVLVDLLLKYFRQGLTKKGNHQIRYELATQRYKIIKIL